MSLYPRKGQLDSVSMVALTPWIACYHTIILPEKKILEEKVDGKDLSDCIEERKEFGLCC